MAICAVFGCDTVKNRKRKKHTASSDIKLYSFPKDPQMAEIWVQKCGRKDEINVKTAFICTKHFTKEQYKRNLKHELLNYTPKSWRSLRDDAVPTKELPCFGDSVGEGNTSQIKAKTEQTPYQVETVFLVEEHSNQGEETVEHIVKCEPGGERQEPFFDSTEKGTAECGIQCEIQGKSLDQNMNTSTEEVLQQVIASQQQKLELLQKEQASITIQKELRQTIGRQWTRIEALQKENESLNQQVLKLTHENHKLKKECTATSNIFSETQRRKLSLGGARVQWTSDDMVKCAAIYASGAQAYKFLLEKGYPFPAVITLKQFLAKNRNKPVL